MRISTKGLEALKVIEGFRPQAYRDVAGKLTIGYGHLIKKGEDFAGQTLTAHQAEVLLQHDIREAEDAVNDLVTFPLRQGQYDALVSFTFNLGRQQLKQSTLLAKLNAGSCCSVPDQLRRWVFAGGRKVGGLANRRAIEIKLWNGEDF